MDANERFDKVPIVNKNSDGTWAYRGKCGIGVAPASEFDANPECDGKKVMVSEGRNRGKTDMIVGEPKVGMGGELGSETDVFKRLLD